MLVLLLDIISFLGRFHPILVHLPIGFIVLALLIEWRLNDKRYNGAITYSWFLSGLFAAIASVCGWFLANDGAYDNWTLFFHRWLGISIAIISFIGWWIRRNSSEQKSLKKITSISIIIAIIITGHLGGNMTHGSGYLLEYAPKTIQNIFGYDPSPIQYPTFTNPDSVNVYADILAPLFEDKCNSCHNDKVQNGGLNLASIEGIQEGGDGGPVVKGGDYTSELLRRVTLPTTSSKFMPTTGMPLTYHEIKILEWWISGGAKFEAQASDLELNESIQATLLARHRLDLTPKSWIEKTIVPNIDSSLLSALRTINWRVNLLAQNNGWIEVLAPRDSSVTSDMITKLPEAREQITWLELKNAGVTDDFMHIINSLDHLTRLQLQYNNITADGIEALTGLRHLESLNLIGNNIDDDVFPLLANFPGLKNIYLWQTDVSKEALENARQEYPDVNIVHAASL